MREIKIHNPVLNSYITDLSEDYASGTTLNVRSNNSFAADDLSVVGNPTEEYTELKKISALSGNQILTLASALKFSHNKATPVYKTLWDYVEIEGRSTSGGVFAVLTQSPIQWDSKTNKTIYFHSAGTDTWQYRFRFYNSVTAAYSEYSPTLSGSGFTRFQAGYLIKRARRLAADKEGRVLTTDELLEALRDAKYIIRAHNAKYWFWKVDGYKNNKSVSATAGNNTYSLASITDLGTVDYIEYRYTQGSVDEKYLLRKKGDPEFLSLTRDLNRPQNDHPTMYRLLPADDSSDKGYFEIENEMQTDSVGTFYISYYKDESDFDSIEDETSIVIPEILIDYLTAEIYATKGNETAAETYRKRFYGPQGRRKTSNFDDLTGIALLDELDRQYKKSQSQPISIWNFRGQKAMSRFYGNRSMLSNDERRERYFDNNGD
jgi:hypothetical protein